MKLQPKTSAPKSAESTQTGDNDLTAPSEGSSECSQPRSGWEDTSLNSGYRPVPRRNNHSCQKTKLKILLAK